MSPTLDFVCWQGPANCRNSSGRTAADITGCRSAEERLQNNLKEIDRLLRLMATRTASSEIAPIDAERRRWPCQGRSKDWGGSSYSDNSVINVFPSSEFAPARAWPSSLPCDTRRRVQAGLPLGQAGPCIFGKKLLSSRYN